MQFPERGNINCIVVELVGLCSLCDGNTKRAVNRNVQGPLKSRPKGGAIFSDAFGQGTIRTSQVMD